MPLSPILQMNPLPPLAQQSLPSLPENHSIGASSNNGEVLVNGLPITPHNLNLGSNSPISSSRIIPAKQQKHSGGGSNNKKYRCCYCDRAFSRSEHRTRHERSHTKERPFHCPKCPSTFVRRDLLLRHDRTVHAPKTKGGPEEKKLNDGSSSSSSGSTSSSGPTLPSLDMLGGPLSLSTLANAATTSNTDSLNIQSTAGVGSDSSRSGILGGDGDDLNAAMLMTELQRSYSKEQKSPVVAKKQQQQQHQPHSQQQTDSQQHPQSQPPNEIKTQQIQQFSSQQGLQQQQQQPPQQETRIHKQETKEPPLLSSQLQSDDKFVNTNGGATTTRRSPLSPPLFAGILNSSSDSNSSNNVSTNGNHSSDSQLMSHQQQPHNLSFHQFDFFDRSKQSNEQQANVNSNNNNNNHGGMYLPPFQFRKDSTFSTNSNISTDAHSQFSATGSHHSSITDATPPHPIPSTSSIPQFKSESYFSHLLKFFNDNDTLMKGQQLLHTAPTKLQVNRYLSSYFNFFHPFLPFLHMASFDPHAMAPALVFSVCSIGAALCNEINMATSLHATSKMIVSSIQQLSKDFPNAHNASPIWATQATILNVVYASWSGDPRGLEYISSCRSHLVEVVTNGVYDFSMRDLRGRQPTWQQWQQDEQAKRAFFAVYLVFGSLTAIFNYPSAIDNSRIPAKLQLPCSEVLWSTAFESESDWMFHYVNESNSMPTPLFCDSYQNYLLDNTNGNANGRVISPLGLKILITALLLDVTGATSPNNPFYTMKPRLIAGLKNWEIIGRDSHPGQGQLVSQMALNSPLFNLTAPMLDLNGKKSILISRVKTQQHPLIVSGHIISLVSQIRLLIDLTSVQEVIRYHVPHDICHASLHTLGILTNTGRLKSHEMTCLITQCFDIFQLPSMLGLRLLKSMLSNPLIAAAADSLLCGFEISLVVIMWCHRVEQDMMNVVDSPDPDELTVYEAIERLCNDCGLEKVQGQLAPTLAVYAADILEGIECWGLANVLSLSLRSFGYSLFPSTGQGVQNQTTARGANNMANGNSNTNNLRRMMSTSSTPISTSNLAINQRRLSTAYSHRETPILPPPTT
ncbi:hypothetical protein AWJ20_1485 [Sugiyamaella lignohabitans]|uniref:C2H2-type domain-containing protein n=1 Tax=Sugiyamaella lignohabitans TaxID=796027 RepID=A0A167DRH3_9ASCO|nr:uncharacterized protein AWJ20_1485 [Sugiyamaella lignohabitans]ANB13203.1 hypothetical protein AWJ20_1485 [Sugiyamaella lignohabitans]